MNQHTYGPRLFDIHNTHRQLETSECYIRGKIDEHRGEASGSVFLICEKAECRRGGGTYTAPFQQQVPDNCLPELLVMMRSAHLATHSEPATLHVQPYSNARPRQFVWNCDTVSCTVLQFLSPSHRGSLKSSATVCPMCGKFSSNCQREEDF